jgi:hypothetical protein
MAKARTVPPLDEIAELKQGLTRDEDDELRRLHWFSQVGELAARKRERMIELRIRDRRQDIRPLRGHGEPDAGPPVHSTRRWLKFLGR